MNNTLKVLLISAIPALVVVSVVTYLRPNNVVVKEIKELVKEQVGAMPGNEIQGNRLVLGGQTLLAFNAATRNSSTTLCSFDMKATSTLVAVDVKINTPSTTALFLEIGKARTPEATTTSLGMADLAAGIRGTFRATSSVTGFDGPWVFGPDDFLNIKFGGASCDDTNVCTNMVGECNALLIE